LKDDEYCKKVVDAYMITLRTIGTISGSELPDFKDVDEDDLVDEMDFISIHSK